MNALIVLNVLDLPIAKALARTYHWLAGPCYLSFRIDFSMTVTNVAFSAVTLPMIKDLSVRRSVRPVGRSVCHALGRTRGTYGRLCI